MHNVPIHRAPYRRIQMAWAALALADRMFHRALSSRPPSRASPLAPFCCRAFWVPSATRRRKLSRPKQKRPGAVVEPCTCASRGTKELPTLP